MTNHRPGVPPCSTCMVISMTLMSVVSHHAVHACCSWETVWGFRGVSSNLLQRTNLLELTRRSSRPYSARDGIARPRLTRTALRTKSRVQRQEHARPKKRQGPRNIAWTSATRTREVLRAFDSFLGAHDQGSTFDRSKQQACIACSCLRHPPL